ncbi:hypothetical protein, partial [Shewanella sp.]|uniref:hypothetical protein n=1 Tax=Shewanella sp. TaxID=50422 RepID=UPI0025D80E08
MHIRSFIHIHVITTLVHPVQHPQQAIDSHEGKAFEHTPQQQLDSGSKALPERRDKAIDSQMKPIQK